MTRINILQQQRDDLAALNLKLSRTMRSYKADTRTYETARSDYHYNLDRITAIDQQMRDLEECEKYARFLSRHKGWIEQETEYRDRLDRSSINESLRKGLIKNSLHRQELIRTAIKRHEVR